MKPPRDGEDISAETTTDELLARVIPLRHRAVGSSQPPSESAPDPLKDPPPPRKHSVWDPSSSEPLLRRRPSPATTAMPVSPAAPVRGSRVRAHVGEALVAGAAALAVTVVVLLGLGGSHGGSGPAPPQTGALETGAPTPANTAPQHIARLHPSSHRLLATSSGNAVASHASRRTGAAVTTTASAPASAGTPVGPRGASGEFGLER